MLVWTVIAVPTYCAGASSVTAAENCAESATTDTPQRSATTAMRKNRPANEWSDRQRAHPAHSHGDDGHQGPPDAVRDHTSYDTSDSARGYGREANAAAIGGATDDATLHTPRTPR
jgi:hypothetical protein